MSNRVKDIDIQRECETERERQDRKNGWFESSRVESRRSESVAKKSEQLSIQVRKSATITITITNYNYI